MGGEEREDRHVCGYIGDASGRARLVDRVWHFLVGQGYNVALYADTKACVDLVARKGDTLLLIRVLTNVDALREESAREFIRLASVLRAFPVVVGTHTKHGRLEDGVLYRRYGIPAMTPGAFEDAVCGELPLAEEYRGKRIVHIDEQKLRLRREELGLTLRQLASLVGTTKESIYRYEHGYPPSEQIAVKLERVLGVRLRTGVEPFKIPSTRSEAASSTFKEISRIVPVSVFKRTPWDALSGRKIMFSEIRGNLLRRAELLQRGKQIVARFVAFYSRSSAGENIHGVPVITQQDVEEVSSERELIKLLRERDEG